MKYSFLGIIFFFTCIALSSCENYDQDDAAETQTKQNDLKVDTTIVIQIGEQKITAFEIEKNFELFRQTLWKKDHRAPTDEDRTSWVKKFTDRAYILADAHTKGYYNDRKDVKAIIENTASMMLVQPHGLFEKWLTRGLKPDDIEKETDEAKNENKKMVETRLKQNIVGNYYKKINKLTALSLDSARLNFLDKILKKEKNTHEIKLTDIYAVRDKALSTYNAPDGTKAVITMADFMEYYNSLPIKKYLMDTGMVKMYLQNMAAGTYVKRDAENNGLLNDAEFKLNKKNFNDNVVYQKYRDEELRGTNPVSEEEILKTYSEVKSTMLRPTDIVYSVFTFSSLQKAGDARFFLQKNSNNDKLRLDALSEKRHIRFKENSNKLADTLKKSLFGLQPGQISLPVQIGDYYTILLMESSGGKVPFQLNDIRPYLISVIMEKRKYNNEQKRIAELYAKYKKTGAIDTKLLSGI